VVILIIFVIFGGIVFFGLIWKYFFFEKSVV
jgi:hypothetical protein